MKVTCFLEYKKLLKTHNKHLSLDSYTMFSKSFFAIDVVDVRRKKRCIHAV